MGDSSPTGQLTPLCLKVRLFTFLWSFSILLNSQAFCHVSSQLAGTSNYSVKMSGSSGTDELHPLCSHKCYTVIEAKIGWLYYYATKDPIYTLR